MRRALPTRFDGPFPAAIVGVRRLASRFRAAFNAPGSHAPKHAIASATRHEVPLDAISRVAALTLCRPFPLFERPPGA